MQTNYADTVLNLNVTGGLVRLDLGTLVPVEGKDGKRGLKATPTQQVVMPLEGFLQAFSLQEKLVRKLLAEGVLKAKAADDGERMETLTVADSGN